MNSLIGLLSLAAFAATPPAVDAPQAAQDEGPEICKRITTTGSRVSGKRLCMTAKQWDLAGEKTRSELKGTLDRGTCGGNGGCRGGG